LVLLVSRRVKKGWKEGGCGGGDGGLSSFSVSLSRGCGWEMEDKTFWVAMRSYIVLVVGCVEVTVSWS